MTNNFVFSLIILFIFVQTCYTSVPFFDAAISECQIKWISRASDNVNATCITRTDCSTWNGCIENIYNVWSNATEKTEYFNICLTSISFHYLDNMNENIIKTNVTNQIFARISECDLTNVSHNAASNIDTFKGHCQIKSKCGDWNSCMYQIRNTVKSVSNGDAIHVCLAGIQIRPS